MGNFTFEEMNLMCIYNTGSRTGLIDSLREMRGELAPEETELRELTDSALGKLCLLYTSSRKDGKRKGTAGRGIRHAPQEGFPDGRGFVPVSYTHLLFIYGLYILLTEKND